MDRRRNIRLNVQFLSQLRREGSDFDLGAVTDNVSQIGAFVKTEAWKTFQLSEQVEVTFFVPPSFSGQDVIIGLKGLAFIARLNERREGIGLEFTKSLKQFDPIQEHLLTQS